MKACTLLQKMASGSSGGHLRITTLVRSGTAALAAATPALAAFDFDGFVFLPCAGTPAELSFGGIHRVVEKDQTQISAQTVRHA